MITPEERAVSLYEELQYLEVRADQVRLIERFISQAIEDDRRTRPTLVGAPMGDDSLKYTTDLAKDWKVAYQKWLTDTGDVQLAGNASLLADHIAIQSPAMLDHITFLESVISDLRKELGQ